MRVCERSEESLGVPTPSGPPRFCQHHVDCACVLVGDSQTWDLAGDASELEVGETRQRPCSDQGGKTEGTQALGVKCSPPPLCPKSKKSQKESSLDLARDLLAAKRQSSSQVTR